MSNLPYALRYASRGWRVFPLRAETKVPLTPHGFKDATTDERIITAWWDLNTNANIGLDIPEGLLILDFDPRNMGPNGPFPKDFKSTRTVDTPGGGSHLYFTVPHDREFRGRLAPGVDVKAPGKGYVLLPPSSIEGAPYRWLNSLTPRPLPQWALDRVSRAPRDRGDLQSTVPPRYFPFEKGTRYGLTALYNGVANMMEAENGNRNNTLFRETCKLLEVINGGELSMSALSDLVRAAQMTGLPYFEIRQVMESAEERVGDRAWVK